MIDIDYIPDECMYCSKRVAAIITKTRFGHRVRSSVCKECAKKIWQEETNRKLP